MGNHLPEIIVYFCRVRGFVVLVHLFGHGNPPRFVGIGDGDNAGVRVLLEPVLVVIADVTATDKADIHTIARSIFAEHRARHNGWNAKYR